MSASPYSTLALTVHNTGFLLDRLGADCHPLQFLRELTQNSIEAILRTPEKSGEIIWDVDWTNFDQGGDVTFKLCITDNGCGMTGEEMVRYLNQLSSSASVQSLDGNYGVGAKIAAATRNHAGLIYLSWKDGIGSMIHLWRDPKTEQYGLRQFAKPDGSFGHYATIEEAVKPELINQHGTRIVLYGMTPEADSMKAPPDAPSPSRWIAKNLNARYFRFPSGITIRAREGWEQPRSNKDANLLRTLTGQEQYLSNHLQESGQVQLSGAVAHWWVLKDENAISQSSGHIESSGHIAAIYKDELYDMAVSRSGHARHQQFGVIFGQKQVVIYLEPFSGNTYRVGTNTARTQLLLNGEPLPWTEWAAEFREKMPDPIHALMDSIASKSSGVDHGKSIRDRLKALMDLYKVSRYRPTINGALRIDLPQPATGGRPGAAGTGGISGSGNDGGRPSKTGPVGGVYSTFVKADGIPGVEIKPDLFPQVKWVSVIDKTREEGDIEDKAAKYLGDQHLLLINSDFRVFADMVKHWTELYSKERSETAGLKEIVTESVHSWYEQALVETVIGVQALKGSREWSVKEINAALSEEALTSVVMQRYHPFNSVKRELGTKIAPLKRF